MIVKYFVPSGQNPKLIFKRQKGTFADIITTADIKKDIKKIFKEKKYNHLK